MVDLLPNNLEEIIALRLELTQQEKLVIKESIDAIDVKIKSAINHIGLRPRESDVELVASMNKLEHTHNTTSSTNALERAFMYDMKKLQEKKKYLVEYNAMQKTLDDLKIRRTSLQKELREKDASLDELYLGSRKLKLAEKIGCSAGELVESKFTVPAEKLSQIIGKGGVTLQKIETDYKVSIEAKETKNGNIRVTGTESSIASAITAIFTIVSAVTEEITLPDDKLACLIVDKAALAHEIEGRCDVRIDVSRAKKVCKLSGQPDGVQSAIDEIRSILSLRIQIPIDVAILPFVVGKGGATIKAVGDGNRVIIDIERDAKLIIVAGFQEDTKRVASILLDIITENTEVEEVIKINKNAMYGCIIGSGGQIIRSLQKDLNVQIQTEKMEKNEKTEKGEKMDKGGKAEKVDKSGFENLTIRGVTSKVIVAKAKILELLASYRASTEEIHVTDDMMALVVGKKGAKISLLRERYPDAVIDIEGNVVRIQSASAATREAVRIAIDDLVKANFSSSLPVSLDMGIAMKGSRGNDVRAALAALNVQMDILPEAGCVKLRGLQQSVASAAEALETFFVNNYSIEVECLEDDFSSIFNMGSAESSLKTIETAHRVEIRANRKDGTLRIRGEKGDVESAQAALDGLLRGDVHLGSTVFPVDSQAFASIIGKGGATLKKFETDNDVRVDLLKSRSSVRVRGTPDAVQAAKLALVRFVDDIKTISSVDVATLSPKDAGIASSSDKNIQKIIDVANSIFHLDVSLDKTTVTFRGNLFLVEEAKTYIKDQLRSSATFSEPLPLRMVEAVRLLEKDLEVIRGKHSVEIEVLPTGGEGEKNGNRSLPRIEVRGSTEAVTLSKVLLFKLFKRAFPAEFTSVTLPGSCLKELGAVFPFEVAQSCWGAQLTVDRQMGCVRIMGEDCALGDAVKVVEQKLAVWCGHHASVPVEEYMLPSIIGKNGATILGLQKDLHIKIRLNRTAMLLEIETTSATDPKVLEDALKAVTERVAALKQHTWSTTISTTSIGLFVGKQGVRINKIRTESGASVEVNKTTGMIELRGSESCVEAGKELVLEILADMPQVATLQIPVPARAFPLIIGPKGVKAQEITDLSGARFDLDRPNEMASIRGTPEACQKLKELIEEILEIEGFGTPVAVVVDEEVVKVVDSGHYKDLGPIPGAVYDAAAAAAAKARAAELSMSKSAIRRRRRKEQDHNEREEEALEGVEEVEEEHQVTEEEEDEVEEGEEEEESSEVSGYGSSDISTPPEESPIATPPAVPSASVSVPLSDTDSESRSIPPAVGIIGRSSSGLSSPALIVPPPVETKVEKSYNHFNPPGFALPQAAETLFNTTNPVSIKAQPPSLSEQLALLLAPTPAAALPIVPAAVCVEKAPVKQTQTTTPLPGEGPRAPSTGLLDMLLGYSVPIPTPAPSSAPLPVIQHQPETKKLSLDLERQLALASLSIPTHTEQTKSPKLTPRGADSDAAESKKSGYYKSKSGFSVRL